MTEAKIVVDDGRNELARIDVATNGIQSSREAGIAIANKHATPLRPLRVRVEWTIGGELVSHVVHVTTLESIAAALPVPPPAAHRDRS